MLTALVLLPALEVGEPPAQPLPAKPETPTEETAFMGGMGVAGGEGAGGLALSLSVLHNVHFVELGAEAYGAAALGGRVGSLGGLFGVHLGGDFWLRALAAVGVHGYEAVGSKMLSDDPGVDGSTPYVGGRLMLGYSIRGRSSLFFGVAAMFDEDLERQTKSVTYQSEDWLFGGTTTQRNTHVIGQTTWGLLFVFGREFDIARY